jgi:hypothetical protein
LNQSSYVITRAGIGDGDGVVGDPVGVDGDEGSSLGAGPIGWAPLSAHAAVSTVRTATIAIRRFMGCLLLSGTQPMLAATRNTGTAVVSRFCNGVGQTQREP